MLPCDPADHPGTHLSKAVPKSHGPRPPTLPHRATRQPRLAPPLCRYCLTDSGRRVLQGAPAGRNSPHHPRARPSPGAAVSVVWAATKPNEATPSANAKGSNAVPARAREAREGRRATDRRAGRGAHGALARPVLDDEATAIAAAAVVFPPHTPLRRAQPCGHARSTGVDLRRAHPSDGRPRQLDMTPRGRLPRQCQRVVPERGVWGREATAVASTATRAWQVDFSARRWRQAGPSPIIWPPP